VLGIWLARLTVNQVLTTCRFDSCRPHATIRRNIKCSVLITEKSFKETLNALFLQQRKVSKEEKCHTLRGWKIFSHILQHTENAYLSGKNSMSHASIAQQVRALN
jgi:hypothetical protein